MARRVTLFALGLLAFAALGTGLLFSLGARSRARDVAGPPSGTILYLREGDIWEFSLQTGQHRRFLDAGSGSVTHVAHSFDRELLAYSVLHLSPSYQILGSDIVVSAADGSAGRVVVHEAGAVVVVSWPAWNGDGTRIAYMATAMIGGSQRVEELELGSGVRMALVEGGSSPAVSPDGRWVAYDHLTNRGWSIWSLNRSDGSHKELASESWFKDSDVPAFSPDGATVAFVAVGDGPRTESPLGPLLGLLGKQLLPIAEAHELADPFDLWSVRPDGSDLRRVARLQNWQPYISWSPDGRHIAVWGGQGLQIVEVASGGVQAPTAEAIAGSISWGR